MPVPTITTNYGDYNLGLNNTRKPTPGKKVYMIGTATDGPENQPIPIPNLKEAQRIFGDLSTANGATLVRGLAEMFDTPGHKQIYAIRIGDGSTASLELRERTTYSGIKSPTPYTTDTESYDSSVALTIRARYPGEIYNDTVVGYTTRDNVGTVFFFYNPKTKIYTYFSYDTDSDNENVSIHNVSELAAAMNASSNIGPWYIVTTQAIRSAFECWVLPVTSDVDYGYTEDDEIEEAYGVTWNTLMNAGKLPSEWSDGWSFVSGTSKFNLSNRLVDSGRDTTIEHPGNGPGWEVLQEGMISGTGPVKANETCVNNIASFNSLYSLSYTGVKIINSTTNTAQLSPMPFDTRGRKGWTTGSLAPYKIDGLQLKRPNAEPVNEVDPLEEDITTWASEYSMYFKYYNITDGDIGADNNGYLEFESFLPLDFSAWPKYWGSKKFSNLTDPISRVVIGRSFEGTCWYDESIAETHPSNMHYLQYGNVMYPGVIDGGVDIVAPTGTGDAGDGELIPGVTRDGMYREVWSTDYTTYPEIYRLPGYYLDKGTGVTRTYPYTDMACTVGTDPSTASIYPERLYQPLKDTFVDRAWNYFAYFPGTLSLNYLYKPVSYDYDTDDITDDISEMNVLVARPTGETYSKYDISFALNRVLAADEDATALYFDNRLDAHQIFGSAIEAADDESLDPSSRAIVLPIQRRELLSGTINNLGVMTVDPTYEDDEGVVQTIAAPDDGDTIVINNRIITYEGTTLNRWLPYIDVYDDDATWDLTGGYYVFAGDTTTSTANAANMGNARHYAECLAAEDDYSFYDNYKSDLYPVLEYSLDSGGSWFEVDPRYIAYMVWTDNGQLYPNDTTLLNMFKIEFVGTGKYDPDDATSELDGSGTANDIWSQWKWLWEHELANDATLADRYPNLYYDATASSSGFFVDDPDERLEEMTEAMWADFIKWAEHTRPPFLYINEDYTNMEIHSSARFRISSSTYKGNLSQTHTRSSVEESGRSDYYFISGRNIHFGAVPPGYMAISYLNKIDYVANKDYTVDVDGVITFTNPHVQPFGTTTANYTEFKRFLIGMDFNYLPEWVYLPSRMSLTGGNSGVYMDTETKYKKLEDMLELLSDNAPEILVPIDYYADEIMQDYSEDTNIPYYRNAGLIEVLSEWLEEVNANAWTTRAVIPYMNPTSNSLAVIEDWITRLATIDRTDPLRGANIAATTDCKWIDSVAFPMIYIYGGQFWNTTMQCMYAGMLASNVLPELPAGQPIPITFTPNAILRTKSVNRILNSRINTIRFNDAGRYIIASFITGAIETSDYHRGYRREIAAEVVKAIKRVWEGYAGKIGTAAVKQAFKTAAVKAAQSVGGTQSVNLQVSQTPEMEMRGEIKATVIIQPYGEMLSLVIDLSLQQPSAQG